MNKLLINDEKIENMIYEIRGCQVMLDSDLAKLYQCKNGTKEINQAVRNNPDKFPKGFCFKLTPADMGNLWSKNLTANINSKSRSYPTVFTEQGVYMLATILKGKVATQVTIAIMETFILMRKYISNNLIENKYYKEMLISHDNRIKQLEEQFKTKNNHLFYEGQIYDAYSLLKDIFSLSNKSIFIIDNYIDKKLLDSLSNVDKKILIITNQYNNNDYEKYKSQYTNINIKIDNSFHDRFIIIDRKILYHCGSSFKDLGKKCFAITKIEDNEILQNILNKLEKW